MKTLIHLINLHPTCNTSRVVREYKLNPREFSKSRFDPHTPAKLFRAALKKHSAPSLLRYLQEFNTAGPEILEKEISQIEPPAHARQKRHTAGECYNNRDINPYNNTRWDITLSSGEFLSLVTEEERASDTQA